MAEEDQKPTVPPYVTYTTFHNWIMGLRKNGLPSHITRSVLPGSNSGKATMAVSLRAMGLIDGNGEPSKLLLQLTDPKEDYASILKAILENTYSFLTDGSIDLKNTTTEKVVEKITKLGASGSTVSKCMAFFLAAAKAAGITVSPWVKAPPPPRSASPRKGRKLGKQQDLEEEEEDTNEIDEDVESENMTVIPIPLHGMADGKILLPADLEEEDWAYAVNMAKFILENYRRKGGA